MNILIIGSGGREHALGWKLSQSAKSNQLFFAPGNAGTSTLGLNIETAVTDFNRLKQVALDNQIQLMIVGPEVPLVVGIHDFFANDEQLKHIMVIGPKKKGAMLEGSKDFAKEFMSRNQIPTARYMSVTTVTHENGISFLKSLNPPYVLKADGLAAGKGVLIIDDFDDAVKALKEMLDGKFGEAGEKVVIEEFLDGIELSVFVLTDGINYKLLPEAKDYKRIGVGDSGLNTGGMGAVSPVPFADDGFMKKVEKLIIQPTINGLRTEGIEYQGFIFFGLINVGGNPYVIEYNVRMGDPETEAVMLRIKSDLADLLVSTAKGNLVNETMEVDEMAAATVMLVAGGYPGNYKKGREISGLDKVSSGVVFHAGTKNEKGRVVTNGGRVLAVSSSGETIRHALDAIYKNAELIEYDEKYFRNDIGFDL